MLAPLINHKCLPKTHIQKLVHKSFYLKAWGGLFIYSPCIFIAISAIFQVSSRLLKVFYLLFYFLPSDQQSPRLFERVLWSEWLQGKGFAERTDVRSAAPAFRWSYARTTCIQPSEIPLKGLSDGIDNLLWLSKRSAHHGLAVRLHYLP